MKKTKTLITCGASALLATALTLQAQTSGSGGSAGSTGGAGSTGSSMTAPGSAGSSMSTPGASGSTNGSSTFGSSAGQNNAGTSMTPNTNTGSTSGATSGAMSAPSGGAMTGSTYSNSQYPSTGTQSTYYNNNGMSSSASGSASTQFGTNNSTSGSTQQSGTSQFGSNTQQQSGTNTQQFGTAQSTVSGGGVATVDDTQITTVVHQLDTAGPAVVTQLTSQVGELACSPQTVQNLVDALHNGTSVTLTSDVNGQTQSATFNPNGAHLGYGEAYLAVALASQELRNAGVSTCATPDQWQAALLGGSINATSTSTSMAASGPTQFPGIVKLRTEGQGWGQIAQATNVQLGQVVSNVNINGTANAPTGNASEMYRGSSTSSVDQNNAGDKAKHKHHWFNFGHKDKNETKAEENTNNSDNSASTHADTTSNPSSTESSSTPSTP